MIDKFVLGIEVNGKTAGNKAQKDINQIAEEQGYAPVKYKIAGGRITQFLSKRCFLRMLNRIPVNSKVLLQYPLAGNLEPKILEYVEKRQDLCLILLIHDLDILRNSDNEAAQNLEQKLLHRASKIIVHNSAMKRELLTRIDNLDSADLIELELFDYLCDLSESDTKKPANKNAVVVAGNLIKEKSGYVYKLGEGTTNLTYHLYGVNFEGVEGEHTVFHGSFQPEDLPQKLERGFGLVWDGQELQECSGNFGEYLKYNNPHKLSLYVAAGMPVVVWSKAAVKQLVEKENIGLVIDSVMDLEKQIANLSDEQYQIMMQNAARLGEKVRQGYFAKRALSALEEG